MPQAIPLAAGYVASNAAAAIGASVATQAIVASAAAAIAPTVALFAISTAVSYAFNAANKPPEAKPSDGQSEFQQPVPPRFIPYGRVQISGPLAFFATDSLDAVGKVILLSARQIDAIETHKLDDRVLTLDSNGWVTNSYQESGTDKVQVNSYVGQDGQTANGPMMTEFNEWTSDHRLRGIAYAVMIAHDAAPEAQQKVFPNHIPTYKAILRGALLYDPRKDSTVTGGSGTHLFADKSTWEWSSLAGLAILDWLTYADGYNKPISKIDLPSFMAFINMCDEDVSLKAGGTEKRYLIATTVLMTEPRKDVLRRLCAACDARLYTTRDGKIGIRGGEWTAPTVTLDAEQGHIRDADFSAGLPVLNTYNELTIRYMSPAHDYTEVEGDPWQNEADILERGVESRSLDLLQVPSHGQARRLAKIFMARENPRWVGSLGTNFVGLNAIGEEVISLSWDEFDGESDDFNGAFWIDGDMEIMADCTGMVIPVRSAEPTAYDWNAATEEGTAPAVPTA